MRMPPSKRVRIYWTWKRDAAFGCLVLFISEDRKSTQGGTCSSSQKIENPPKVVRILASNGPPSEEVHLQVLTAPVTCQNHNHSLSRSSSSHLWALRRVFVVHVLLTDAPVRQLDRIKTTRPSKSSVCSLWTWSKRRHLIDLIFNECI